MPTPCKNLRFSLLTSIFILLLQIFFVQKTLAEEIRISAAASLTDAMNELNALWQKQHPEQQIKISFAGSSTLAKQIEHGAPADIFISADKDWADYLEERKLLDATNRIDLLKNALVVITPANRDTQITMDSQFDPSPLLKGRLCTGDTASVPVGKYAKQALEHYGWWNAVKRSLVETEDVRTALAFVERGECALGIVYRTDALITDKVKIIGTFANESHPAIVYPGALTQKANTSSRQFWLFLQSPTATEVFSRYGFITR